MATDEIKVRHGRPLLCFWPIEPGLEMASTHFMLSCHRLSFTGSVSTFQDWCMIFGMVLLPPNCQGAACEPWGPHNRPVLATMNSSSTLHCCILIQDLHQWACYDSEDAFFVAGKVTFQGFSEAFVSDSISTIGSRMRFMGGHYVLDSSLTNISNCVGRFRQQILCFDKSRKPEDEPRRRARKQAVAAPPECPRYDMPCSAYEG